MQGRNLRKKRKKMRRTKTPTMHIGAPPRHQEGGIKKQGARGRGGRRGHEARRADQKEVKEDESESDSQSEYGRMARDSGRSSQRSEGTTGSKFTL